MILKAIKAIKAIKTDELPRVLRSSSPPELRYNKASAARASGNSGADSDGRPNPHPFAGEQVPLWGHSLLVRLKGVGNAKR